MRALAYAVIPFLDVWVLSEVEAAIAKKAGRLIMRMDQDDDNNISIDEWRGRKRSFKKEIVMAMAAYPLMS